jgi:transposase-like protein
MTNAYPPLVRVCDVGSIRPCQTVTLEQVSYTTTCEVVCKFCGSKNVVKNGVRTHGIQYYKCPYCSVEVDNEK